MHMHNSYLTGISINYFISRTVTHAGAILNLIVKEWHGKTHSILVVVVFVFCVICVLYFKNLWYNDSDVNSVG